MKKKILPTQLRIGLYVCELDRPWLETSYEFQGFRIVDRGQIEDLVARYAFVFVDTEKSTPEALAALARAGGAPSAEAPKPVALSPLTSDFYRDVARARQVHSDTRSFVDRVLGASRLGSPIDTAQARDRVSDLVDQVVKNPNTLMWLTHMKQRDEYTAIHCMNVCILAITFGRCIGLDVETLKVLGLGALLHDIGKMQVPDEILNKPGRLTDEEMAVMQQHASLGHAMLVGDKNVPAEALNIVLSHHERLNGQGYPDALHGDQIPQLTRIVTLVDVYDAITSDRAYHNGMTPHDALKRIYDWMPDNFDARLTEQFIRCIGIYPIGSIVELTSGHIGLVTALNEDSRLRPVVMMLMNDKQQPYPERKLINLAHKKWIEGERKIAINRIINPAELGIDITRLIELELARG